ncbi:MAG: ABC transporter substrate-binding protein [Candidatus Dormibacteria bacterium]
MRIGQRAKFSGITLAAALAVAACGGSDNPPNASSSGGGGGAKVGGSVNVWAVWSGAEQKAFTAVLDGFQQKSGVSPSYQSKGDQLPTILGTAISGGSPPDVAILPQPGLLHDLVAKNALKPLDSAVSGTLSSDFGKTWSTLATDNGKLYGVYFKAANKSTMWFNPQVFQQAGIKTPPATWDDMLKDMSTLKQFGVAPFAMCGGSGWTLTDWFENVYLRTAGADKYNQLGKHTIPWTDPSVAEAFTQLQKVFGDPSNMVGGTQGAVSTPFPDCVAQVFGASPKAAMLFEGDFVGSVITGANKAAKAGTDYDFFPWPSIKGSKPAVSGGGDVAVMLKDTPQAQALMKYLASPDAGTIWAKLGGFISPNKKVDTSVYPDAASQKAAKALIDAGDNVAFDMSDTAPAAFGGTAGSGEWADLQAWVRNPSDIKGTQAQLEKDAAAAYGH